MFCFGVLVERLLMTRARAPGYDVEEYKVIAFVLSAGLAVLGSIAPCGAGSSAPSCTAAGSPSGHADLRSRFESVEEKQGSSGPFAILSVVTDFHLPEGTLAVRHTAKRIRAR